MAIIDNIERVAVANDREHKCKAKKTLSTNEDKTKKRHGAFIYSMDATEEELTTDELKALCEGIGIKGSRKNRVLVQRLVKNTGSTELKALKIAYKRATLSSH